MEIGIIRNRGVATNERKLYREYIKSKGFDCKEFIELKYDAYYGVQEVKYKDSKCNFKTTTVGPVKMLHWIIKSFDNGVWDSYKFKIDK